MSGKADAPACPAASRGALVLVPNGLDALQPGNEALAPLSDVLPSAVIARAATIVHWVVEDARSARAFLKRVGAISPLMRPLQEIQIQELPRPAKGRPAPARPSGEPDPWRGLLAPAQAGHDVGLLSEAGLPAVADPGAALVGAAHALGLEVRALPGPSSLLLALAASGLNGQSFAFVGYLPQDPAARAARIRELEATSRRLGQTQILIETPYRNRMLLEALLAALTPATRLSVSVGLTLPEGGTRCDAVSGWRRHAPELPDRVPAVFCLQAV